MLPPSLQGEISGAKGQVSLRIRRVFQGVAEPDDFVQCQSQTILRDNDIQVFTVRNPQNDGGQLEKDCLRIARKGHAPRN
jgi:dolichyldiphosphatase